MTIDLKNNNDINRKFKMAAINLHTVNQQILAARKFGVSQNKVIWRLFGGY